MSMNRRAFLQRFGIGLAAACALASLPVAAVEALTLPEAAKRLACEHLRKCYNDYARGKPAHEHPRVMRVSQGLYEAFEGELTNLERWTDPRDRDLVLEKHLLFKGARVEPTLPALRGWDVEIAA